MTQTTTAPPEFEHDRSAVQVHSLRVLRVSQVFSGAGLAAGVTTGTSVSRSVSASQDCHA